ncbi:MAG: uracil-DNA glycosylase [Pseudomonadota bacterium]
MPALDPPPNCQECPRLAAFRAENVLAQPAWFNGPVPTFGDLDTAELAIVGLAPGLQGANKTGRPFTGDYAGDLLYATLLAHGFANGTYSGHADDGLTLSNCIITNAVRCVPPQNKPTGLEINTCRPFLSATLAAMPRLKVVVALGKIAHDSVVRAHGMKLSGAKFAHAARHDLGRAKLIDSYHCSRYNTNTGRLTADMFSDVFKLVTDVIAASDN